MSATGWPQVAATEPAKTQVMWLDSKFQSERVDIRQVSVLSSEVNVVDAARDLGVTIDSRLTMAVDQVAATWCGIFNLDNCRWSPDRYAPTPRKQSYRRSSCAGWTIVIRCSLAHCSEYKPTRMLQRTMSPPLEQTMSHQSYDSYIGYRSRNEWSTSWLFWRTMQFMDSYRRTWLGTVSWFQQHNVAGWSRPTFAWLVAWHSW